MQWYLSGGQRKTRRRKFSFHCVGSGDKRAVGLGGKKLHLLSYHVDPTWVFKPGAGYVGRCPLERTEAMGMSRPIRREGGMALLGILLAF